MADDAKKAGGDEDRKAKLEAQRKRIQAEMEEQGCAGRGKPRKSKPKQKPTDEVLPPRGLILAGAAYSRQCFMYINGFGEDMMAKLKAKGLKMRDVGNEKAIIGQDWIDFLRGPDADGQDGKVVCRG